MATQRAWVFRLSNWEGDHVVQKRASNPSSLCLTRPQIHQGCQGSWLWKRVWEEAESSFQGRLGRGLGPSTPLTWGLAPGLLVLFLSQVRAEAAGRRLSKSYCLYT